MTARRLSLALLFCLSVAACRRQEPTTFSGTVEMTEHSLGARVAGRLVTLAVDEGDRVTRGQRLATFDRFEKAQRDFNRTQENFKTGGATRQAVEEADLALQDQQIISPVDGVVLTRVRTPGEYVPAGGAVVIVGDQRAYWIRIYVPQGMINRVQMNGQARVRFDGVADPVPGRVTFVAPRAEFTPRNVQTPEERVTQTFAVKITIDQPPAYVRPGVAADVELL